jgi:hypothetical protein
LAAIPLIGSDCAIQWDQLPTFAPDLPVGSFCERPSPPVRKAAVDKPCTNCFASEDDPVKRFAFLILAFDWDEVDRRQCGIFHHTFRKLVNRLETRLEDANLSSDSV